MDLIHEVLQRLCLGSGTVSLPLLEEAAGHLDISPVHARQALDMWQDLDVVELDGDTITLHEGSPPSQPAPAGWAQQAVPLTPSCRSIALLSLFDGMGTARLGIDDLLGHLGRREALTHSWFVESDATLRQAVARAWARRTALTGASPYTPLAGDVCSLLADPTILQQVAPFPPPNRRRDPASYRCCPPPMPGPHRCWG